MKQADLEKISWCSIHFTQKDFFELTKTNLSTKSFFISSINSDNIRSDRDLFSCISNALNFPEYFGDNWDAVDECLSDIDLSDSRGCILIVNNASHFWKNATLTAGKFVTAWQEAAEIWRKEDKSFHLVFIL